MILKTQFYNVAIKPINRLILLTALGLSVSSSTYALTVTASSDDGNPPSNTLDGNLSTRWSANGDGQWISFDIGNLTTIDKIAIAFFKGDQRSSSIDIQISNDSNNWNTVYTGEQPLSTLQLQTFDINDSSARYVRIIGHGNDSNNSSAWNSLTEVEIHTLSPTPTPTPKPTPTSIPTPNPPPGANIQIQAEDYSRYSDSSAGNSGGAYRNDDVDIEVSSDVGGGYNVGWINQGEQLHYDVSIPPGSYTIEARVASPDDGSFTLSTNNGVRVSTQFTGNGSWQNWLTVDVGTVTLYSQTNQISLSMDDSDFNLNWLTFISQSNSQAYTAHMAATKMGKGFNLGQMFDNDQHTPNLSTAKPKIDAYYARGHRTVRIPTTWTEAIDDEYLANPNTGIVNRSSFRLSNLSTIIDYALSKPDMFVVLNTHHEKTLKDENKAAVLAQLWKDISDIYKNKDYRLIFEIINEPHLSDGSAMPAENLRNMTALAYENIRAQDTRRIVIIGGNQWFGAHEVPAVWTNLNQVGGGNDDYLMATFHHYDPWSFSGSYQGDYADNWTNNHMSSPMDIMRDWADGVGKGMPVFIGEWGVGWQSRYSEMRCNNIRLWYTQFNSQYAAPLGMPTAVWDDGGWFRIFDHETNQFDNNLIDCIDGACAWEGTERFNDQCQ